MIIMTVSAVDGWTEDDAKLIEHIQMSQVCYFIFFRYGHVIFNAVLSENAAKLLALLLMLTLPVGMLPFFCV